MNIEQMEESLGRKMIAQAMEDNARCRPTWDQAKLGVEPKLPRETGRKPSPQIIAVLLLFKDRRREMTTPEVAAEVCQKIKPTHNRLQYMEKKGALISEGDRVKTWRRGPLWDDLWTHWQKRLAQ